MSTKRTAAESNNEGSARGGAQGPGQGNEGNPPLRPRLQTIYDTSLQDLPTELIRCILVKAVAMEVKEMRLIKRVSREKVDLVIERLRKVSLQLNSIVGDSHFRDVVYGVLELTVPGMIRLELIEQTNFRRYREKVAVLGTEVFVLTFLGYIDVYDRDNLAKEKESVNLREYDSDCIAACCVSNCVYVLNHFRIDHVKVLRIARNNDRHFDVHPLIPDLKIHNPKPTLAVSANGSLILLAKQKEKLPVIYMFTPDGSLQHEIRMPASVPKYANVHVRPKSNGNLVAFYYHEDESAMLVELDSTGIIMREFKSSANTRFYGDITSVSNYGHMLSCARLDKVEILDAEYNVMNVQHPNTENLSCQNVKHLMFSSNTNEITAVLTDDAYQEGVLATLHLIEE